LPNRNGASVVRKLMASLDYNKTPGL
jgi:hypothetical protein